jgi:hypothetical protein
VAKFLEQLDSLASGFNLPSDFATNTQFGTLEILADPPISVLALRLTTNQRGETLMTATPIDDLDQPTSSGPLYFPQLADGAGYKTTLVLMNGTGQIESGTLFLTDDSGAPLSVKTVTGQPTGSSFSYQIQPRGLYLLQTDGSGVSGSSSPKVGWVRVSPDSSAAPAGAGLFSYSAGGIEITESAVPPAVPTTRARIYVDQSTGHLTGVALANPSGGSVSITAAAFQMDGVTPAGNGLGPVNLGSSGHFSAFVNSLVSGLPAGFTGVMELSSSTPFVALTQRGLLNSRGEFLLTTLPIADLMQSAPSPIIFPQIADGTGGGAYMTQFVMLSAGFSGFADLEFYDDTGLPLTICKTAGK